MSTMGSFLGSSAVKNSPTGDPGLIPELGRSPGKGNGNPLQYSCLENPTDRGAWWATVNRVAKSWTWLSIRPSHSPLGLGVVVEVPWIGSIPGLRLSSQNLPTLLPKCMLSIYASVVHLVTQCVCFLQLTWTGSTMMSSVTVARPGTTPSTWGKSWSSPTWSSFLAASLYSAAEETVAAELSTGSPVHAVQGRLWKSIMRYAVFRTFLLQCCTWTFSSYKSPVISRALGNWAIALFRFFTAQEHLSVRWLCDYTWA